ncbi:tetratricopeptide repeat protein [Thiohalorhabdus methylotrophus]|uniref:Tetratricopeptide repeat protein n=1 Tax=Thiohalorhabdus methylotrophus TaxID=3242694 RepID=A0ABV4TVA9_9GAMM
MENEKPTVDYSGEPVLEEEEQETALADLLWAFLAEQGALALHQGLEETARQLWSRASDPVEGFAQGDPRRAAALNNRGVGQRLAGRLPEAESLFRKAQAAWQEAEGWVADMEHPPRAASSVFHIKLEIKHGRDQYEPVARQEAQRDLAAARSFTLGNLAETVFHRGDAEKARRLFGQAVDLRERGAGPRDRGLELLKANRIYLEGGSPETPRGHHTGRSNEPVPDQWYPWDLVRMRAFNDEEVLRAALRLTVLAGAQALGGRESG